MQIKVEEFNTPIGVVKRATLIYRGRPIVSHEGTLDEMDAETVVDKLRNNLFKVVDEFPEAAQVFKAIESVMDKLNNR